MLMLLNDTVEELLVQAKNPVLVRLLLPLYIRFPDLIRPVLLTARFHRTLVYPGKGGPG